MTSRTRTDRGFDRRHGRHQPVALARDVFDVDGVSGIVAEGGADLGDDLGEGVVGDELGAPHRVDEVPFGGQIAGVHREAHQHVHRTRAQLEDRAVAGDPVERRFHQPVAEMERPSGGARRFSCPLHFERSIGLTG